MTSIQAHQSPLNLSLRFTLYSQTTGSDGTQFTQTKHRQFLLRNFPDTNQEQLIAELVPMMEEIATELHHITGFGVDKADIRRGSTTIHQVVYPDIRPRTEQSLAMSFAIRLRFDHASFKLPACQKTGFFKPGEYSMIYDKQDQVFARFLARFRPEGHLAFGKSAHFGYLLTVSYTYWPPAKRPAKFSKKRPRKSWLASQPNDKTESIYIIEVSGQHIYKIGKSNDPRSRLDSLRTASPYKLKLFHTFSADNASAAEESLHELLQPTRMEGEWFQLASAYSQRLLRIERYQDRQFWIDGQGYSPQELFLPK